ncbi:tRNA epoxyqueuosine(34) reductase QueG [Methylophilus sp. Leaf414]|uniref:tRNA epoxyqueuosine(34) reductase QueG n=1 Tax=Methylophilus sp. Leaf414 TaxID=1736371 RepID=UPI000701B75C|nr:tRNA epoxyqueuosine(34) reductase QueG [Methylophilus sp. Leaf414]KQT37540.1 epoxyqueuosine reductase [Methylophilus sp. Leaf414]
MSDHLHPAPIQLPDHHAAEKMATTIKGWARELGFGNIGITDTDLSAAEPGFMRWLEKKYHGDMDYMAKHGSKRSRPAELVPGTLRVISVSLDYMPDDAQDGWKILEDTNKAYVARYAMGRDYHKVMRQKLQQLCTRITDTFGSFEYRVFADSAPVLEVALATKAGVGWRGKHTLLLNRQQGSWFFLGEIYTNLALPIDQPTTSHCGSCSACIDICPTQAIVAPYELDARRCISYLTIEHKGSIPLELRSLIGNRVYGCDDCQLICPWNKFAVATEESDFAVRNGLDSTDLVTCFTWTETEFQQRMAGSAIYRIGYVQWLRNVAVGLGNAPTSAAVINALTARQHDVNKLVREHVQWALRIHHKNIINQ